MLRDGFTQVPNEVLDDSSVSVPARFLYSVLLSYAWDSNEVYPGQTKLAESLGVSDKSVRAYLSELEKKGYLTKKRRGLNHTNLYTLNKWISTGYERKKVPIKKQKKNPLKKGSQLPSNNTQSKKTQIDHTQSESGDNTRSPLSMDEIVAFCEPHLKEVSLDTGVEVGDVFWVLEKMASHYAAEGKSFKDWVAKLTNWIIQDLESGKIQRSSSVIQERERTAKWEELEDVIVSKFDENWRENEKVFEEVKQFLTTHGELETPVEDLEKYLDYLKEKA